MKKTHYLLIAALMLTTLAMQAQIPKTVYASGPVTTNEREAGTFTSLKVSTGIDVYLSQGEKESITVEADENLHEYILTEVRNGVLYVYSNVSLRNARSKKVHVTMNRIESVSTSSAGDIKGVTLLAVDKITLITSSAGNIDIEIKASEINARISSSGDITLRGNSDLLVASLSSAADLRSTELTVSMADIDVSSAGNARITVTESLKARASSAGSVFYGGKPEFVDAHSSSAGRIRAL